MARKINKVLYFVSNTEKIYIHLYHRLRKRFNELINISVDEIDEFLINDGDERFYVKELSYQFEIYNAENEYVFCINK